MTQFPTTDSLRRSFAKGLSSFYGRVTGSRGKEVPPRTIETNSSRRCTWEFARRCKAMKHSHTPARGRRKDEQGRQVAVVNKSSPSEKPQAWSREVGNPL